MIRYCKICLLPETKPDIFFTSEGACAACKAFQSRESINWAERELEFREIMESNRNSSRWDCIVPVSGGKDSTAQVLKILSLGYQPLCVTATTCDLSDIGRRNLINIRNLGVDHVEYSPNPLIRKKLNKLALQEVGDISWPEHVGIFTIPIRASVDFGVPLIIWGENSQNEYGGPAASQDSKVLTRKWLEEFGGLLGLRVTDLVESYGFSADNLYMYQYPSDKELRDSSTTGLFLGHYFPWSGLSNALIAIAHGFTTKDSIVEGSVVNYENLDNYQTGIHDYFKFLKFGFGRATDIASILIRRGVVSRQEALEIVKEKDGVFPLSYLGKSLPEILDPIEVSMEEFVILCDKFTNREIFQSDAQGLFIRRPDGSPVKTNYDNV